MFPAVKYGQRVKRLFADKKYIKTWAVVNLLPKKYHYLAMFLLPYLV